MYWWLDENVVTRGWQEPNPVLPLGAMGLYSLIWCPWWLYRTKLLWITRTDCVIRISVRRGATEVLRMSEWCVWVCSWQRSFWGEVTVGLRPKGWKEAAEQVENIPSRGTSGVWRWESLGLCGHLSPVRTWWRSRQGPAPKDLLGLAKKFGSYSKGLE